MAGYPGTLSLVLGMGEALLAPVLPQSLGSNADLEALFFSLPIISLLCPPVEVPLLNCSPDLQVLIAHHTLCWA